MADMAGNDALKNPEIKICEKLKDIKNEKKASESLYTAYGTKRDAKEIARGYKICCLDKATASYDIYQDLMSCIVIKNYKKAGIIQKNVDEYIKKDDELEKLINESSKMINELRVKMNEANNEACIVVNCVKECILPPKPKRTKGKKGTNDDEVSDDVSKVEDLLMDIKEKTAMLTTKGQNAFNGVVNIAGIQTFTNTGGLKNFASKLVDTLKIFNDCVADNVKSTEKDVSTYRDELNSIVEELAEVSCTLYNEGSKVKGLHKTGKFICEGECREEELEISCECVDAGNDCNTTEHMATQTANED
ncbi:hypothetical protein [Aquimarina agarilytica]|uniref:hypothetical protein n=1 Tax=Aquimarina agarilytica TaxID=1087449 RepID=UPI000289A914|nr:hypothetical protein [Aquimarina agarilytica]